MKCPRCSREYENPSHVCIYCGYYLRTKTFIASAEEEEQPTLETLNRKKKRVEKKRERLEKKLLKKHRINWAWVSFILSSILLLMLFFGFLWLKYNEKGQVIMVRAGKKGGAYAYWVVGKEEYKKGNLVKAKELFDLAMKDYKPSVQNISNLLNLAETYEALLQHDKALETYMKIYSDVNAIFEKKNFKDSIEEAELKNLLHKGYKNAIRLLRSNDRLAEATALLKEAFEKTEDFSFKKERGQLVPLAPSSSLAGGSHTFSRTFSLISPQGYDIYYTDDPNAELPEGGKLYKEPITIDEGVHEFRAVCVSDRLVSDEMKVKYFISLPVPVAPKANRAPGSYKAGVVVKLKNVDEDKNVNIYYTIDGSKPTVDSPRYTDSGIALPSGKKVLLRAIAENRYKKTSNELIVEYTVSGKFKSYYAREDVFSKFTLLKINLEKFVSMFGKPESENETTDSLMPGSTTVLKYKWGSAKFVTNEAGKMLYYIETNLPSMTGPKGTKIGYSMRDVTSKFKDVNQPNNSSGSKGLYHEENVAKGYFKSSDGSKENGQIIYFRVYSDDKNNGVFYLIYDIEKGKVVRITNYFTPEKTTILEHQK